MNRIRPLALAVVLLLVFGVIGVLTVDEEGGGTVLTTAAAATTAEGSARMTMEMSFEFDGRSTTMTADGLVDFSGERMQMTMKSPVLPVPMELIGEGTTVYIKATTPELTAQAGGKQWLAYDASAFSQFAGNALGGSGDPLSMLRLLEQRGIASNVRQEGREPVRGSETTRYTADIDMAELLENFEQAEIREVAESLRDTVATMSVWIGDDNVVRRSSMAMRFEIGQSTVAATATMELFDFGVAAEIPVPPADQVKQAGDVLQTG